MMRTDLNAQGMQAGHWALGTDERRQVERNFDHRKEKAVGSYFAAKSGGIATANGRVHQFRWSQLDLSARPQHYYLSTH